jgi:FAD/FMN-containing dehydrogenase
VSAPITIDTLAEPVVEALRDRIRGRIVTPADPDYDSLRGIFLGGSDPRPAVIVRVADAGDVAATVKTARETGFPLAVRSGGHSGAGHGTVDGGIVIDLRDMKALEIDPVAKTAWADTGLTAAEVTAAAAEHGLAIGFGDTGSVGIGGISLGGGVGYLGRKFGLAIDNLLAADVVTADGRLVRADADTNPDLFWAIRGGGGNFGVATRFLYRLQEVPSVVGGILILPATAETVAGFIAAAEAAPNELSTIANVMPAPPMPFLPEDQHGKLVILAMVAYAGETAPGERAMAPFRALAEPLADMVREIRYPEMYPPDDEDYHPLAISRNLFVETIDRPVAETIMANLEASDAAMRVAQLRVLGGAIARVPNDATAYAHRARRIMVNVAAFYEGDADKSRREAWVLGFVAALRQGDSGAYVNFVGDEGQARVRDCYPGPTWDRLAAIKAKWDPTNLFQRNQNVPPVPGGEAARPEA